MATARRDSLAPAPSTLSPLSAASLHPDIGSAFPFPDLRTLDPLPIGRDPTARFCVALWAFRDYVRAQYPGEQRRLHAWRVFLHPADWQRLAEFAERYAGIQLEGAPPARRVKARVERIWSFGWSHYGPARSELVPPAVVWVAGDAFTPLPTAPDGSAG